MSGREYLPQIGKNADVIFPVYLGFLEHKKPFL